MQTCNYARVKVCTHIRVLGDRQTTKVVVSHNIIVSRHWGCKGYVTILKTFPLRLVGSDSPVKTGIQRTAGSTLSLEQVIKPR